jgi:peptide chain release factor subunit 1
MAIQDFGLSTLERLSDIETGGYPVVSVYLDLDPSRFPTPASRDAQLGSLLGVARHDAGAKDLDGVKADIDNIHALLVRDPSLMRTARALLLVSCAGASVLQAVRLPDAIEPMAVVDTVPWLEPLAEIVYPGGWGVAVVSRRAARIFRGGPGGLAQFAVIRDELHRRHSQGGWSQARFQRGIEEQVAWHAQHVADRLLRAHRRAPFVVLVIVASDETLPVVLRNLHSDLTALLAGTAHADLEHASTADIERAVIPLVDMAQREREHALVAEIEEGLGTGVAAAAGLDEVLATLLQRRVDALLVPPGSSQVEAIEHAVQEASRQAVPVVVMRHEADWLRSHGGIAARLRW